MTIRGWPLLILLPFTLQYGTYLDEQYPELRHFFFDDIHFEGRNGSWFQYSKFVQYPKDDQISWEDLWLFEDTCGSTGKGLRDQEVYVYLPCNGNVTENGTDTTELLDENGLIWTECTEERGLHFFYAKLELAEPEFITPFSLPTYNLTIDLKRYPDTKPILKLKYWTESCNKTCGDVGRIAMKSVHCDAGYNFETNNLTCKYHPSNDTSCSWQFLDNTPNPQFEIASENDTLITGEYAAIARLPLNESTPAVIASPYYDQITANCKLKFDYHLRGTAGQSHIVVVAEPLFPNDDVPQRWVYGTYHLDNHYARLPPIRLGAFPKPARIRIECHNRNEVDDYRVPKDIYQPTLCGIIGITLFDCHEHPHFEETCNGNYTRYLCRGKEMRVCMDMAYICDGTKDCPQGDDEEGCEWTVPGSRCDFEDHPLCPGWLTKNARPTDVGQFPAIIKRANITQAADDWPPARIPMRDRTHGENGHFQWAYFGVQKELRISKIGYLQHFWSPFFPTNIYSGASGERCYLRFWYCLNGRMAIDETLQVFINNGNETESIHKRRYHDLQIASALPGYMCEWTRGAVHIGAQPTAYRIKMEFPTQGLYTMLMFDDLSLSPTCFNNVL
ncbi:unnamed protein product, partial [Mesorhabditis spiculigera]